MIARTAPFLRSFSMRKHFLLNFGFLTFQSIGLTLPLTAAAGAFFSHMFTFFHFQRPRMFINNASNEALSASRAVHDLKRQKLVCAISRRPSKN